MNVKEDHGPTKEKREEDKDREKRRRTQRGEDDDSEEDRRTERISEEEDMVSIGEYISREPEPVNFSPFYRIIIKR